MLGIVGHSARSTTKVHAPFSGVGFFIASISYPIMVATIKCAANVAVDDTVFESEQGVRERTQWALLGEGEAMRAPYSAYALIAATAETAVALQLPYILSLFLKEAGAEAGSRLKGALGPFVDHLRKKKSEKPWSKIGPPFLERAKEYIDAEAAGPAAPAEAAAEAAEE